MATFILLGRLTGFAREWLLSSVGGANEQTDIAVVLFTLPDLIVSLFLGGGLASTLIPHLNSIDENKKKGTILQVSFLVFTIFSIIALILSLRQNIIWSLLIPGINESIKLKANFNFALVCLSLPITALAGVISAYFNSISKFRLGATGTLFFNGGIILGLLINIPILWRITIGVLIGCSARLIFQLFFLDLFNNLRGVFSKRLITKELLKQFLFNFSFVTALILMPTIGRSWASTISEGSLTLFSYSSKLIELPLGIIIGSLTTVFITKLSKDISTQNIVKSIRIVFLISFLITIPSLIFTPFIVKIVYFKGNFDETQLESLISITRIGYAFLIPQSLLSLFSTIFAASKRQKISAPIGLFMILLLNSLAYFASNNNSLEQIMYSYGYTFLIGSIILYFLLNKYVDNRINRNLLKI